MSRDFGEEISRLRRESVSVLAQRYAEVFGELPRVGNRAWLVKRITWRMQEQLEGTLSERARRRAEELAADANIRLTRSRRPTTRPTARRDGKDRRLPGPGTVLTRRYKGRLLQVTVRGDGFEFDGQVFASLTAVAQAITGSHWNGYRFFGLEGGGR
jgi:hypothetical protein